MYKQQNICAVLDLSYLLYSSCLFCSCRCSVLFVLWLLLVLALLLCSVNCNNGDGYSNSNEWAGQVVDGQIIVETNTTTTATATLTTTAALCVRASAVGLRLGLAVHWRFNQHLAQVFLCVWALVLAKSVAYLWAAHANIVAANVD